MEILMDFGSIECLVTERSHVTVGELKVDSQRGLNFRS